MKIPTMPPMNGLLKSPLQMILALWFVVFSLFPFHVPSNVALAVDSPLGMITVFLAGVAFYVYAHPVLTILYVIYAYVLMYRCTKVTKSHVNTIQYTPIEKKRDQYIKQMNPPKQATLEEEVVRTMAPLGQSNAKETYLGSTFKPVLDDVHNAMVIP